MQGRNYARPLLAVIALGALLVAAGLTSPWFAQDDEEPAVVLGTQASDASAAAAFALDPEAAPPPAGAIMPSFWAEAPQFKPTAATAPAVAGLSAVVIDEASGQVLFDKDAHLPLPPASLTKIATLILALEYGRLDEAVVSDVEGASMRGSTIMGLEVGDRFSLRDLLYGMMLPSGNDAAVVIGRHIAGSDAAFVARMNDLVRRLGLQDTRFMNPHGLGGGGLHVASAYDLAMLSRYGMSLPGFREVVTPGEGTTPGRITISARAEEVGDNSGEIDAAVEGEA